MDDLVAFLNARLDEDERIAKATLDVNIRARVSRGAPVPRWHWRDNSRIIESSDGSSRNTQIPRAETWTSEGEHIARHDPARVLAEVAAKRQILDVWEATRDDQVSPHPLTTRIPVLLAAPYADHPDYREEWTP